MIPDFDEHGYLPPGAHPATLDEIAERFGQSTEIRRVQMESLRWLVDLSRRAGVSRLIVNGSFVTDALDPNDVDCVLLLEPSVVLEETVANELLEGLPFVTMQIVEQEEFEYFVTRFFATDRDNIRKGMVEILL